MSLWQKKDTIVDGEAIQIDQTRVDELYGRAPHGTIYGEFILPISYDERR